MSTSEDKMKTFNEALLEEIKNTDELLLPLLREYLNSIRDIRMAMGSEVKTIIQSVRQLSEITKYGPELLELTKTILALEKVLTPSMIETLRRITNDKL